MNNLVELLTEQQQLQMLVVRAWLLKVHEEKQEQAAARVAALDFGSTTTLPTGELL